MKRAAAAAALAIALDLGFLAGQSRAGELAAAIGDGDDVRRAVLVGPSGEIYEPRGDGSWQRHLAGGVAADVAGAARVGDQIYVAGRSTPLFRLRGAFWEAFRLSNRGRTSLAGASGAPALAVGKHVYVARAKVWVRLAAADRTLVAVWAWNDRRAVAINELGQIGRVTDRGFAVVAASFAAGERPMLLAGGAAAAYAIGDRGSVVEIGAAGAARPIARDPALPAFVPQAAACAPDGTLWIVGARSSGGASALALATVQNRRLVPGEALGTSAARATLLVADGHGGLLVGLEAGAVRFRGADGTWHDGVVGDALPSGPGRRDAGPARLR